MPSSPTDEDIIAGVVVKRLKSKFYFIHTQTHTQSPIYEERSICNFKFLRLVHLSFFPINITGNSTWVLWAVLEVMESHCLGFQARSISLELCDFWKVIKPWTSVSSSEKNDIKMICIRMVRIKWHNQPTHTLPRVWYMIEPSLI